MDSFLVDKGPAFLSEFIPPSHIRWRCTGCSNLRLLAEVEIATVVMGGVLFLPNSPQQLPHVYNAFLLLMRYDA